MPSRGCFSNIAESLFFLYHASMKYGGPQVSRQKRKALGKREIISAKEKCSQQKKKKKRKKYIMSFLGVAWCNVNNYSLVELILKMDKPRQKYTFIFGTNEFQILLGLILTSFENRHRKSTSFSGI